MNIYNFFITDLDNNKKSNTLPGKTFFKTKMCPNF